MLLTLALSGCAGLGDPERSRPVLRIGVAASYPPVLFEEEGEIVGIEADLARLVTNAIGRRIVYERYAFEELFDALLRGDVDMVMGGLSVTPDREARVRFTKPYMQVGQLAIIRSADIGRFGRPHLIRRVGARVGYVRDTTGEDYVASTLRRSTSFAFDDVESGIRSLRAGRIDYFIHDAPTVWRLAGDPSARDLHGLYQPLTDEHLAWAVHPGNVKLQTMIDTSLAHWQREGLVEPIIDRWIPVRVTIR